MGISSESQSVKVGSGAAGSGPPMVVKEEVEQAAVMETYPRTCGDCLR